MSDTRILEVAETEIGTFYLGSRTIADVAERVYEIFIGEDVLMTSLAPVSERALSVNALALHPGEGRLRVLVGGLGLGYTAAAALEDSRTERVRVVEKMPFIIDWMQSGRLPLSRTFSDDERLDIVQADIYEVLLGPATETYDLILVDVDHAPDDPLSPTSDSFYTAIGQRQVAKHLRTGGVLGVWSAVEDDNFLRALSKVYSQSNCEAITWQDREFPEADYQNALFFAQL